MAGRLSHIVGLGLCGLVGTMGLIGIGRSTAAPATDPRPSIVVQTQDSRSFGAGSPATQLMQQARSRGTVKVIARVKAPGVVAQSLTKAAAAAQAAALIRVQQNVASRVMGRMTGNGIVMLPRLPYLGLTVTEAQLARLLTDHEVTLVQEDRLLRPGKRPLGGGNNASPGAGVMLIEADKLWARTDGTAALAPAKARKTLPASGRGTGTAIAILDTGVDSTLADFSGKIAAEACFSTIGNSTILSLCPGGVASSTAKGSGINCPTSVFGCDHGTQYASVAVGGDMNLLGVAPNASLIPIQVFTEFTDEADCSWAETTPCAMSYTSDMLAGLQQVLTFNSALTSVKITSVLIGIGYGANAGTCDADNPALAEAFSQLLAADIAPVVAAGNSGQTGKIGSPACVSSAIPVASTNLPATTGGPESVSSFSNFSDLISLAAPGAEITAMSPGGSTPETVCGTGIAAAHVAGSLALLRSSLTAPVSIADMVGALASSGQLVPSPIEGGAPVNRINVQRAYNLLAKPSNVSQTFTFITAADGDWWTQLLGTWAVNTTDQTYQLAFNQNGPWNGSWIPNNQKNVTVSATMRRIDTDPNLDSTHRWYSGLCVKAAIDQSGKTASGYCFSYDKAGRTRGYRLTNVDLKTYTGDVYEISNCSNLNPSWVIPQDYNNLTVTASDAGVINFYINNNAACGSSGFTDTAFASGAVGMAAILTPVPPYGTQAFDVKTITISPTISPPVPTKPGRVPKAKLVPVRPGGMFNPLPKKAH